MVYWKHYYTRNSVYLISIAYLKDVRGFFLAWTEFFSNCKVPLPSIMRQNIQKFSDSQHFILKLVTFPLHKSFSRHLSMKSLSLNDSIIKIRHVLIKKCFIFIPWFIWLYIIRIWISLQINLQVSNAWQSFIHPTRQVTVRCQERSRVIQAEVVLCAICDKWWFSELEVKSIRVKFRGWAIWCVIDGSCQNSAFEK